MNRAEKQETIREIQEVIQGNETFYLVDFKGLKVKEISELRERVKDASGNFRVVKNTLLRKASEGTNLNEALSWMEGPTALAWSGNDPVPLAKVLVDFTKDYPSLKVKGGVLDGKAVDNNEVTTLSKLPGLDGLRSKIVGLLQAPASKIVTLFQTPGKNIAVCLKQKGEE